MRDLVGDRDQPTQNDLARLIDKVIESSLQDPDPFVSGLAGILQGMAQNKKKTIRQLAKFIRNENNSREHRMMLLIVAWAYWTHWVELTMESDPDDSDD